MLQQRKPVGEHLREWRQRRRLSQLDLACEAEISARHLSFLETGRAQPSREMVLRLAEQLQVPLRDRNLLLVSAGYAPVFPERPLDDPALSPARTAVELILKAHEPSPALAIDRGWNLVLANAAVAPLLRDVAPALLQLPVNVFRLALHPDGLAPRTVNLPEWRAHLLERLRREIEITADSGLIALMDEVAAYPAPAGPRHRPDPAAVVVPFQLATPSGVLSLVSTTTVFGTPVDVTVSELALETFFPADDATARALAAALAAT
ncbi:helix-turn-helix transcriptional regulator [Phenylobacterium sp.]|jgi:transcriptional regulator with XRE-family HTH domain|uniref:helix-turn-helix domain-containing protein n=1 Tax=Phenylobacterium sp. TaxID=1871053 RepID=UPI002F940C44